MTAPNTQTARLALDCATEGLSMVLQTSDKKQYLQNHPGTRTSDLLPTALQTLFAESATSAANLTEIRLTIGPGSFTGIRLGLATAEALKLLATSPRELLRADGDVSALPTWPAIPSTDGRDGATGRAPTLQILGFSTLQALALQVVQEKTPSQPFTLLLDAAGGQAYTQTFTSTGEPASEAACLPLAEITLTPATFAPTSLMLTGTQPLPPLQANTLLSLPESLALPPYPMYLKPLTYKKAAE